MQGIRPCVAFILATFQFLWPFAVISARCTDGGKVWDSSTQNVTSSVHLFAKAGANLKVPCERFIIQYHCVNQSPKIWYKWLCRRFIRLCQIWCKSVHGGLLGKWVKITNFYLFIYLYLFHELTYRSDPTTDFHAWWLKRRGLAQEGCASWGFRWYIAPHFGVKSPQIPVWGVNRRFQAKRA